MNCLSHALPDTIFALNRNEFRRIQSRSAMPPKSQVACQWSPCLPNATPAPFSSSQMRKTVAIPLVFHVMLPIKRLSSRGSFASHVAKTQHLTRKKTTRLTPPPSGVCSRSPSECAPSSTSGPSLSAIHPSTARRRFVVVPPPQDRHFGHCLIHATDPRSRPLA